MIDGRGLHMKQLKDKNRKKIERYLKSHPMTTKKAAAAAMGISIGTLQNHLRAM